jgi:hypothetical protein
MAKVALQQGNYANFKRECSEVRVPKVELPHTKQSSQLVRIAAKKLSIFSKN